MDDELSAQARRLIDAAMAQDVPHAAVVDDSWGMVISRVTVEQASQPVDGGIAAAPAVVVASRKPWGGLIATFILLAAVGATAILVTRPSRPNPAAAVTPTEPAPAPAHMHTPAEVAPIVAKPIDTTALLDDAEAALATAPARALELLDRHATATPATDAERRMALRIVVLCALGRTGDAKADAKAFLSTPRDPKWTDRVRASCADE